MSRPHPESTLPPGLYDAVVTDALREALGGSGGALVSTIEALDPGDAHEVLARHFAGLFRRALASLPAAQRPAVQVEIVNQLIAHLAHATRQAVDQTDRIEASVLKEVAERDPIRAHRPVSHPGVPLSQSALLTNARGEYGLGHEIALEIASADRVDLLCSFIKWSGINVLRDAIEAHRAKGRPLRIITTTYLGATDRRALDELARLGAEIRVSFDTRRTRLHAKAWLFERKSGFTTAYIGSSNLSASAQTHGLEWNVRVSTIDAPQIVEKFVGTFESYWADPDFEPYDASDAAKERFDQAVQNERPSDDTVLTYFDIRPWPFQEEVLERLALERETYGRTRNLVVAATGTDSRTNETKISRRGDCGARTSTRSRFGSDLETIPQFTMQVAVSSRIRTGPDVSDSRVRRARPQNVTGTPTTRTRDTPKSAVHGSPEHHDCDFVRFSGARKLRLPPGLDKYGRHPSSCRAYGHARNSR